MNACLDVIALFERLERTSSSQLNRENFSLDTGHHSFNTSIHLEI